MQVKVNRWLQTNLAMSVSVFVVDVQLPAGTTEIVPSTGVVCEGEGVIQ